MPVAITANSYEPELEPDAIERLRHMAAEARGWELAVTLACAVAGAQGWRTEARELLREISEGIVPEPRQ